MALIFRPARPGEAGALSALCLRSKAVWGYDAAFIAACRAELTLGAEDFALCRLAVAELAGQVAGLAQVGPGPGPDVAELWKLFIAPEAQGRGLGRALMAWSCAAARARGARTLHIVADPGAEAFYRRIGASRTGEAPSGSIPGRVLPVLHLAL